VETHETNPTEVDTDEDGMPDKWEVDNGTDPVVDDAQEDPDDDDLVNLKEYLAGSNPLDSDTDGDTIDDGMEVLDFLSDPLVADFDGTVTNLCVVNGADTNGGLGSWTAVGASIRAGDAGVLRLTAEAAFGRFGPSPAKNDARGSPTRRDRSWSHRFIPHFPPGPSRVGAVTPGRVSAPRTL
jgi:hypothetical protein